VRVVVRSYFALFYDYKITGKENLTRRNRKSDKFIYTANHVSELDPPLVSLAVNRPIAYMAKKELFAATDKRHWLIKNLGAFAVDRTKPEIATFKTVRDILSTSWSLGVFPQGCTKPYGKLEDIKKGFIVIAKHAKADIIPVAINKFSGYPKLIPFTRQKVEVHIGKPISYELGEEEIMYHWCKQISDMADYQNMMPLPALL
jgi:1-acyl-sn-glycerol-3-phosphate acyltransferase